LPGYVLVRMDLTDDSWGIVRHTPSVTGFVGQSTTPIPLTFDEVVKMLTPSVVARVSHENADKAPSPKAKPKVEVADYEVANRCRSLMVLSLVSQPRSRRSTRTTSALRLWLRSLAAPPRWTSSSTRSRRSEPDFGPTGRVA